MDGKNVGFEYLETMATIRSDSVHAVKHQYKYQIHLKVHDGSFNAHEKCKKKKKASKQGCVAPHFRIKSDGYRVRPLKQSIGNWGPYVSCKRATGRSKKSKNSSC